MLPFAAIRGLFEVRVESQEHGVGIIPSVEAEMRERMAEPYLSAEECLEKAMKLMGEGDILANDQKFQLAIDRYIAAFAAMHIICVGRRRAVCKSSFYLICPSVRLFGLINIRKRQDLNVICLESECDEVEEKSTSTLGRHTLTFAEGPMHGLNVF